MEKMIDEIFIKNGLEPPKLKKTVDPDYTISYKKH